MGLENEHLILAISDRIAAFEPAEALNEIRRVPILYRFVRAFEVHDGVACADHVAPVDGIPLAQLAAVVILAVQRRTRSNERARKQKNRDTPGRDHEFAQHSNSTCLLIHRSPVARAIRRHEGFPGGLPRKEC